MTDRVPALQELGAGSGPVWTGDCRGRLRAGSFDDRWLAEAIAIVSQKPQLLDKVFEAEVPAQGAVRVRLWRFGRWETVLLDDRLPVPLCITSDASGEVWPALLEKAFAKYGNRKPAKPTAKQLARHQAFLTTVVAVALVAGSTAATPVCPAGTCFGASRT